MTKLFRGRKSKFATALSLMLCVSILFCGNVFAADSNVAKTEGSPFSTIKEALASIGEDNITVEDDGIATYIPAAPLTDLFIYQVISEYGQLETVPYNATTTSNIHKGNWVQMITIEEGYQGYRYSSYMNNKMTLTDTEYVDLDGNGIADGWIALWTYEGAVAGGILKARAQSATVPIKMFEDSVYLR